MSKKYKTWILCSTEGLIKRGYESYTRELVENLNKDYPDTVLLIRTKANNKTENITLNVFNILERGGLFNLLLSKLIRKYHPYYLHLIGFTFSIFFLIIIKKPKIVYIVEGTVYKYLFIFKKYFYKNFKLIYFTGGQLMATTPADNSVYLHHVTPCYMELASQLGFDNNKQFLIPHFTNTNPIQYHNADDLRKKFGIGKNALIILSVGSIDKIFKRMDYVIEEFAKLKQEKFLILLGHKTDQTLIIEEVANKHLNKEEYLFLTVPKEEIDQFYQLADIVVSASVNEGFGLMYIEALANNKIPIVHDFPVSRYVLDEFAIFRNLQQPNTLKEAIENFDELVKTINKKKIYPFINERYSWKNQSALYYNYLIS